MSDLTMANPLCVRIASDIMFVALQQLAEDRDVKAKIITELEVARDMVIDSQPKFIPETVCLIHLIHDSVQEIVTNNANGVFHVHSKN